MAVNARVLKGEDALYIGGAWSAPVDGSVVEVVSPATEEVVGRAALAGAADVDAAVAAAREAFDRGPWPRLTLEERASYLRRLAESFVDHAELFAQLLTSEVGSPIAAVTSGEAAGAAALITHAIGDAERFPWTELRDGFDAQVEVRRVPVGVVGAIVPWNFPVSLAISKVAPALLSGSTVVLKPASETPLSTILIAQLADEIGLPAGVLNVVPAERDVSELLVRHPGVDKIAFTGSTTAGKRVAALCGEQVKRCTLELGGKSAAILLADADLDTVMPALAPWTVFNNGQTCFNQTRVLAQRARYDEVVDAITQAVGAFRVGDPSDPSTDIGPVLNQRQRARVEGYIQSGIDEGARITLGGGRSSFTRGHYVEPTVFAGVDNGMKIAREEIFGPVVAVIPYDSEDEAVAIANDSDYGLAGSVWGADAEHAKHLGRQLRAGTVGVNDIIIDFAAPFGGFKQSGLGREMGPEGLGAYTEYQAVCYREPSGSGPSPS